MSLLHEENPETRTNFDFIFQIVLYQGLWFLLWRLLSHFYGNKLSRNSLSRVFSLFFGGWILLFSMVNYFGQGRKDAAAKNTWSENTYLSRVLSFLIADLIIQLSHDVYNQLYVAHHLLSFVAVTSALITGKGGSVVFAGVLVTEFVNIFQNVKGVLEDLELVSSKLYFFSEGLYIGLFALSRGIFGPLYFYWVLKNFREYPVIFLLCLVLLAAISYLPTSAVRDSALSWWSTFSDTYLQPYFSQENGAAKPADGPYGDDARSETASQAGGRSVAQSRAGQSKHRSEASRAKQIAGSSENQATQSPNKSRHGSVHRFETYTTPAAAGTPRTAD